MRACIRMWACTYAACHWKRVKRDTEHISPIKIIVMASLSSFRYSLSFSIFSFSWWLAGEVGIFSFFSFSFLHASNSFRLTYFIDFKKYEKNKIASRKIALLDFIWQANLIGTRFMSASKKIWSIGKDYVRMRTRSGAHSRTVARARTYLCVCTCIDTDADTI